MDRVTGLVGSCQLIRLISAAQKLSYDFGGAGITAAVYSVIGECRTHAEITLMMATGLGETGHMDNYLATWKTDLKSS